MEDRLPGVLVGVEQQPVTRLGDAFLLRDLVRDGDHLAQQLRVGRGTEEGVRIGPLINADAVTKAGDLVDDAVSRGATVLTGGSAIDGAGTFYAPTVLTGVVQGSDILREEIFGPVLSIIAFDDDDDAVRIANNSRYGLAGAVWGSPERAQAVARRMRTGAVDVNGGAFNPAAPFGGYKQSGIGRELGVHGLTEFQQTKAIQQ